MAHKCLKVILLINSMFWLSCLADRSFVIDYENDCFLKDGHSFRYISGGMHYFRIPSIYWKDRISKAKALGTNTIQTYIPWNVHEPIHGNYSFTGENDLLRFIDLVHAEGLLLILRPGPYIDAEWEFGGFPSWLAKDKTMRMRTSDTKYMNYVHRWFNVLLTKLKPKLYGNGGPVIAFQVENEYGNYDACDKEYLLQLKEIFDRNLGENYVVLFTTDGYIDKHMQCGTSPEIFKTIDFGTEITAQKAFQQQRKYQPKGPLVNSEYYTGWLDYWGRPHQTRDAQLIAQHLDDILAMNASVNLYMLHGGTNFGFMNGVDIGDDGSRLISPTSYDYDAPISEAGDTTWKYFEIRNVLQKYVIHPLPPVPENTTKNYVGNISLVPTHSFRKFKEYLVEWGLVPVKSKEPLSMEDLNLGYGFVIYTPNVPLRYHNEVVTLLFEGIASDDIKIIVDGVIRVILVGTIREVTVLLGTDLDILVENQGRAAYAPSGIPYLPEQKGIYGDVKIKETNETLTGWLMYNMNDTTIWEANSPISKNSASNMEYSEPSKNDVGEFEYQMVYQGFFVTGNATDSFLRLRGFDKGQVYINAFNLGRFWQSKGPQQTLFVPKHVFGEAGWANILVISLSSCGNEKQAFQAEFLNAPILS